MGTLMPSQGKGMAGNVEPLPKPFKGYHWGIEPRTLEQNKVT